MALSFGCGTPVGKCGIKPSGACWRAAGLQIPNCFAVKWVSHSSRLNIFQNF